MKLLDLIDELHVLTRGAPYAVIGGLAQILWARKTHTDDLDVALTSGALAAAHDRVRTGEAADGWTLPTAPDRAHEIDDVFEVVHLLYGEVVVDLITFAHQAFTTEIIETAQPVAELRGIRFVRPELLLVTHLLRPGARGALAAIELVLARREAGELDAAYARQWARELGKADTLERAFARADEMALG